MERKKAQIWVETVVYTLIGISIIGILLAIAKPKIDEIRDRLIIEQTIESFNQIHRMIILIQDSPGNQRTPGLKLSKGKVFIDGESNKIYWIMDSKYKYSQPGSVVNLGNLEILTEVANPYKVTLTLDYAEKLDLLVSNENKVLEIEESPTPYKLVILNKGTEITNIEVK